MWALRILSLFTMLRYRTKTYTLFNTEYDQTMRKCLNTVMKSPGFLLLNEAIGIFAASMIHINTVIVKTEWFSVADEASYLCFQQIKYKLEL